MTCEPDFASSFSLSLLKGMLPVFCNFAMNKSDKKGGEKRNERVGKCGKARLKGLSVPTGRIAKGKLGKLQI